MESKMYQVSTLQALALGYTKPVIKVEDLLMHGNTGLGTFEDVNGEMIVVDGHCYRASETGAVSEVPLYTGVPFASVASISGGRTKAIEAMDDIDKLKEFLDLTIEEIFALNSMHMVRIDGEFTRIKARSEEPYRSHHVTLKDILDKTQRDFEFTDTKGTLVCVYYPDFMDGINAPGWHLHYLSEDRREGGHVFGIDMKSGTATFMRLTSIEIKLPDEPAFDTYSLRSASMGDIKKVEQGQD